MGRALAVLLCRCRSAPVTLFTREQTGHAVVEQGELKLGGVSTGRVPTAAGSGQPGVLGVVSDAGELPDRCGIVFATKGPQLAGCIALGRMAERAEVAQVIAFLVSAEAGFMTGSPVVADGGLLTQLSSTRPAVMGEIS